MRSLNKKNKVVLVGGGSAGPVVPLLATADYLKTNNPELEFLLIGTNYGPERNLAKLHEINFKPIIAGKLRRYFSLQTVLAPLLILIGFFQALNILSKYKPQIAFGAGGFVQVPVLWAAWLLKIPVVIHQQDVLKTLSNTLCAPIAKKITVTFESSLKSFGSNLGLFSKQNSSKVIHTGNPSRYTIKDLKREEGLEYFKLKNNLPIILVTGGGTGASFLNEFILKSLPSLTSFCQVIHSTGVGKKSQTNLPNYYSFEFINRMDLAYSVCDIVISRAGVGAITELSSLSKPTIFIPIPKTHQEDNAALLWGMGAGIILEQDYLETEKFSKLIRKLLLDSEAQKTLATNMHQLMPENSTEKISNIILEIIHEQN